ncbi:MAG: hypothetical protein WB853_01195, partial [Desulfobacterales bacterium]
QLTHAMRVVRENMGFILLRRLFYGPEKDVGYLGRGNTGAVRIAWIDEHRLQTSPGFNGAGLGGDVVGKRREKTDAHIGDDFRRSAVAATFTKQS